MNTKLKEMHDLVNSLPVITEEQDISTKGKIKNLEMLLIKLQQRYD